MMTNLNVFEHSSSENGLMPQQRPSDIERLLWGAIPSDLTGRTFSSFHKLSQLFPETEDYTELRPITSKDIGADSFDNKAGILYIRVRKDPVFKFAERVAYLCKSCKVYVVGPPKLIDLDFSSFESPGQSFLDEGKNKYSAMCTHCDNSLLSKKYYW